MSTEHWWNDIDWKFLSLGLYSISDREMGIECKWRDIDRGKLHYSEKTSLSVTFSTANFTWT